MDRHAGDDSIVWRRLTPMQWVGIGRDGVIGRIEIGRRCVVTDGEGRVFGRLRHLSEAQALLAALHAERRPGPYGRRSQRAAPHGTAA